MKLLASLIFPAVVTFPEFFDSTVNAFKLQKTVAGKMQLAGMFRTHQRNYAKMERKEKARLAGVRKANAAAQRAYATQAAQATQMQAEQAVCTRLEQACTPGNVNCIIISGTKTYTNFII